MDRLETLSSEEVKFQVDQAISDLVSPIKMKDEMVSQLKTQIVDLERFIQYLHGETGWDGNCTCSCPKHGTASSSSSSVHHNELEHEEEVMQIK
jgi:hypothetical protein